MRLGTSLRFAFPSSPNSYAMFRAALDALPKGGFIERPMGAVNTHTQARNLIEVTAAAREAGLDMLFVGDHHAVPPEYANAFSPIPTLARLIQPAGPMPLGMVLLAPFYNPVLLAEQIGTLAAFAEAPPTIALALGQVRRQFAAFEIEEHSRVECKLCVAVCPTGAIRKDGHFDFGACYTHNYRHFLGGFTDWVEDVVESADAKNYRSRVSDSESASVWQSLTTGSAYKAAYCVSVCPAGEDVLGPYLDDRKTHLAEVVRPLQDKVETVYVVAGSDAEAYTSRRFPHKRTKRVGNGLRPRTVDGFARGLTLTFQREAARALDAVYHFTFVGAEQRDSPSRSGSQS